jgi:hypothetical protein
MTDLHNKLAWSVDEFSQLTGLSRRQINRGVREGTLPRPRTIGKTQRFFAVDLNRSDPFHARPYADQGAITHEKTIQAYKDPLAF